MDEEPNWRLVQLDFYNILAPAVTKVPEAKADVEARTYIHHHASEFTDLSIRALMHGFDSAVDPNDVAHLLEDEPIPLRSMRIPIRRNISAGWAPNGYGKTYIFDFLDRQTRFMNEGVELPDTLLEAQRMNEDPLVVGARELTERYISEGFLPYEGKPYFGKNHWESLFGLWQKELDVVSLNEALCNPPAGTVSIASSVDELKFKLDQKYGDGTLSGCSKDGEDMLYPEIDKLKEFCESTHWTQEDIRLNTEHPNSKLVPYHCRGCLVERTTTGDLFGILEFPTVSSWDDYLQEDVPAMFFRKISTAADRSDTTEPGWSYSRSNDWKELSYEMDKEEGFFGLMKSNFEGVEDPEEVRSWMNSFDVEYVEIPKLASKDRFPEFLNAQSSRFPSPFVFNSNRYQALAFNNEPLTPVQIPKGLVHDHGVLRVFEEIQDEIGLICDPNFIGIDEVGYEARLATIRSLVSELENTSREWAEFGEALFDDDDSVWGREVKEIVAHLFDIRFGYREQDDVRRDIYTQLCQVFSELTAHSSIRVYTGFPQPPRSFDSLKAFTLIFDWMEVMIQHPYSSDAVLDVETMNQHHDVEYYLIEKGTSFSRAVGLCARQERERLRYETHALEDFEDFEDFEDIEDFRDDLDMYSRELVRFMDAIVNGDRTFPHNFIHADAREEWVVKDILEMTFKALGIDFTFEDGVLVYPAENQYVLTKDLNRCLSPKDHAHNPWGVEASILFEADEENDTSKQATIQFHPASTDRMNTLRPEHLSFGMRSETVLQLKLSEFLSEGRNDRHQLPDLLIIDEPEIGRSEYWTTMLIHRLRRLEQQIGTDGQQSVLIVSHRGDVLENCTQSGDYTIMHRTPQSEE